MGRRSKNKQRQVEQYTHRGKDRVNNPPVGLVTPETDGREDVKTYRHDPHLDPQLQWAGKEERTSFEVPTVSLHVHERMDPIPSLMPCANERRIPSSYLYFLRRQRIRQFARQLSFISIARIGPTD